MRVLLQYIIVLGLSLACEAKPWPYNRYHGIPSNRGRYHPDLTRPEFGREPSNGFGDWLHDIVEHDETGKLKNIFLNGSVPRKPTLQDILDNVDIPEHVPKDDSPGRAHVEALFSHLNYPIDPECTSNTSKWWYRTYDGSCNWLKTGEIAEGQYGTARARDYDQHYYADNIGKPRDGPNARAVSNAFFRRKKTLFYEHTPFMLGLVEFIMHDITYSKDSTTEFVEVPMPEDEDHFYQNTTFRIWRTEKADGTGTDRKNPRESANMATTWLDVSSLYGSTEEVARKLRSFQGGRMLTQEIQAPGTKGSASYLPFNTMDVPTRTRPGVKMEKLFAGGDPRTNEDWIMLSVHTLLLREHNRLCGILAKQHPEYDDETLYQTVRIIMAAKFALIGNAYQMAYWTDSMPWPRDDGFPLYREMYGEDFLDINPANSYPWPLVTKNGKPMTVSAEMSIVYRFHEFIIESIPIKNAANDTLWDQKLFDTGFNATGFLDTGLENILRGAASTYIPNFKSGVDESFRSAGKYRGKPFDIVTWSIVHEREQGLPTFNNYFRAYNKQDPKVHVPIRKRFEDFSSDPEYVASLKKLYKSPDDVDLVVGVQLDEEMFPHTTIPKSALIISLFSLFGMGNSDRFSIGYAAMRCFLVDKPWDCHPSNALENLLWKPMPKAGFPHFRFYDPLWMTELDFQAHGTNLLWRLVTENTEIKCLQRNPLFPVDEKKNPILCSLPPQKVDYGVIGVTAVEVSLSTIRSHKLEIFCGLVALVAFIWGVRQFKSREYPPAILGWPIVGKALDFQKDAKKVLLEGFADYGSSKSKVFGMKLAALTHYVLTEPADLKMMLDDNPYEIKFSAAKFFDAIAVPTILRVNDYSSHIDVINLIQTHMSNKELVSRLAATMQAAGDHYLRENPLIPEGATSKKWTNLGDYLNSYITIICARAMVGEDAYAHPEFVALLKEFNDDTDKVMGLGQMLPPFLQFIPKWMIGKSFNKFRKILLPIIQRRRANPGEGQGGYLDFMPFVLELIDDDKRASDLITLSIWFGLRNLQASLTSTLYDIQNVPGLSSQIVSSLKGATIDNLNIFGSNTTINTPWAFLRSAIFESIRLCGTVTGPARIISSPKPIPLASDPELKLPPKQAATLSPYYTHRHAAVYGADAAEYRADRFITQDPDVGSTNYIAWGMRGPHLCPGRWFAQEALCVLAKQLLSLYEFEPERLLDDEEKYFYHAGVVVRREVPVVVSRRK